MQEIPDLIIGIHRLLIYVVTHFVFEVVAVCLVFQFQHAFIDVVGRIVKLQLAAAVGKKRSQFGRRNDGRRFLGTGADAFVQLQIGNRVIKRSPDGDVTADRPFRGIHGTDEILSAGLRQIHLGRSNVDRIIADPAGIKRAAHQIFAFSALFQERSQIQPFFDKGVVGQHLPPDTGDFSAVFKNRRLGHNSVICLPDIFIVRRVKMNDVARRRIVLELGRLRRGKIARFGRQTDKIFTVRRLTGNLAADLSRDRRRQRAGQH